MSLSENPVSIKQIPRVIFCPPWSCWDTFESDFPLTVCSRFICFEMTSREPAGMSPQYNKAPYTIVEVKATLLPPELRAYQTCPTWTQWLQSVASHSEVDTSWRGDTKTSHTLSALSEHSLCCGPLGLSWTNYVRVKIIWRIRKPQIPIFENVPFS